MNLWFVVGGVKFKVSFCCISGLDVSATALGCGGTVRHGGVSATVSPSLEPLVLGFALSCCCVS